VWKGKGACVNIYQHYGINKLIKIKQLKNKSNSFILGIGYRRMAFQN
jgi:hypothetical protein